MRAAIRWYLDAVCGDWEWYRQRGGEWEYFEDFDGYAITGFWRRIGTSRRLVR